MKRAKNEPTTHRLRLRLPPPPLHYNVHRWLAPGIGSYTRPDPLFSPRTSEMYLYAWQQPLNFVDRMGLQASQASRGTATFRGSCCPPNEDCCAAALSLGFFDATGGGGLTICCNGRKVPCSIAYTGLPPGRMHVQGLLIRCILNHEQDHVRDLPPCPQRCGVAPATFPTAQDRAASECSATLTELACLDQAVPACGGDPDCLTVLQGRRDQIGGQRIEFGCQL